MKEIKEFINNVMIDYRTLDSVITKKDKRGCWFRIIRTLFIIIWNIITSPFIYPIWYFNRGFITRRVYEGTTWEEIASLIERGETEIAKEELKKNGKFLYWLWTYGDCDNPLGNGGMPDWYGKNTFYRRWRWSALRNPRMNINYLDFRTGKIMDSISVIDRRNFYYKHKSKGIGDSPDGIYFKWMRDNNDRWYFIYEDNNREHLWYFGYTGLLLDDVGYCGGRFEMSYRKTEGSYNVEGDCVYVDFK